MQIARVLGNDEMAAGIRTALRAAAMIGKEGVEALARAWDAGATTTSPLSSLSGALSGLEPHRLVSQGNRHAGGVR